MNWRKRYSSEHLESADIPEGKRPTVTIKAIGTEAMDGDKGKENKAKITFEPSEGFGRICKKTTWIAAKTCGYCLEAMFGKDDDAWIGKRVTLYVEQLSTGDEGLRIYGSPDIDKEIRLRVREFGRGKRTLTLHPTGQEVQ